MLYEVITNSLYFISGYSGKDALYSLDLTTKQVVRLYEPRFGAAYPAINSAGKILLSDYTANGYRVIELSNLVITSYSIHYTKLYDPRNLLRT